MPLRPEAPVGDCYCGGLPDVHPCGVVDCEHDNFGRGVE